MILIRNGCNNSKNNDINKNGCNNSKNNDIYIILCVG